MTKSAEDFAECTECLCFGLRRAARIMTQHFDRQLRRAGLRATQFTLLATLAQTGPLPINRLASHLALERTTLTRNLRPLEARRWVKVEESEDRRVRSVTITGEGRAMARKVLPTWRKAQATARLKLGDLGLGPLLGG